MFNKKMSCENLKGDFSFRKYRRDILYFVFYFVLFLVVYSSMFMRLGLHWDELLDRYGGANGTYVAAGRWGLALFRSILGKGAMPWFYGLVAAGSIAVALVLQVRMFRFETSLLRVLYGALYISCTQFLYQLRYSYQGDAVAFGILCATVGMYILSTSNFNRSRAMVAVLLFIASIAMYQSLGVYIVALGLCWLLIREDDSYLLKRAVFLFLCLSIASIVWLGISKIAISIGCANCSDVCYTSAVQDGLVGWKAMLEEAHKGNYYIMKWYLLLIPRVVLGTTYAGAWLYATVLVPFLVLSWKSLRRGRIFYFRMFALTVLWLSPCATSLIMGWACPQVRAELATPLCLAFLWIFYLRDYRLVGRRAIFSLLLALFVLVRAGYTVSSYAWRERIETIRTHHVENTIARDYLPSHQ